MTRYKTDYLSREYAFRSDFPAGKTDDLINNIEHYIAQAELLKDGNSATVVKTIVADQETVIKRYNIKDRQHFIRRCLRPSRAAVSWHNANLLEFIGIPTTKPLGFIETRQYGLRHTAYFIAEYNEADELFDVYQNREPTKDELAQLKFIFYLMGQAKVSHGDLKASNFLINKDGKINLIDLDAMKMHPCKPSFDKAFAKDKRRFMQNWQQASLKAALEKIF
jgi:serine/threonine protein kinase